MNFKITRRVATIAALFVFAAAVVRGATAYADSNSVPLRVQDCVSTAATQEISFPGLDNATVTQQAMPAMVIIGYVNTASTPISSIDFGLVSNGKLVTMFRDVGTFAPDAHIMHAFGVYDRDLPYLSSSMACVPLRIHYANGTSWLNPVMPSM